MPQFNVQVSDAAMQTIKDMKKRFGVDSDAAAIRHALALADIVLSESEGNIVIIKSKDNKEKRISLSE